VREAALWKHDSCPPAIGRKEAEVAGMEHTEAKGDRRQKNLEDTAETQFDLNGLSCDYAH